MTSVADATATYSKSLVEAIMPGLPVDEYGVITVKQVGDEIVQVVPMIYNDRIVITRDPGYGYDHGWCYDKGTLALVVALIWDPSTDPEPPGYKKRATPGLRTL